MSLQEDWDKFFQERPNGGPWDIENNYNPDLHIVNWAREYNIPSTVRVLDAGCGDGRNTKYLVSKGCQVVGVDISKTVIDRAAKSIPDATFVHGDVRDLPFGTGTFDYIIDAGALHVNHPDDALFIIEEYHRVLLNVSSSRMFIRVFAVGNNIKYSYEPIFHVTKDKLPVYGYTVEDFESLIEDHFHINRRTFDPMYGAHGEGCNYYHLSRKT
tara:strand:- start:19 stop:657 length:639 start_codon:yes stop_codon:yes gene_type:complete